MRSDLLRWGGVFSLLLALLFTVTLVLGFAMGVDIYADEEVDELLVDVNGNQEAFAVWAVIGMVTSLLYFPAALGFYFSARESDRPFLALPAGLFALAAAISVVGYGSGVILLGVADNYVEASGPTQEALLHDGETLQSSVLLFQGVALTPFALGMLAIGVMGVRSAFLPRWFAWATIAVALLGTVPFIGFVVIVPGRILWLLVSGVIMLRRAGSEVPALNATPVPSLA